MGQTKKELNENAKKSSDEFLQSNTNSSLLLNQITVSNLSYLVIIFGKTAKITINMDISNEKNDIIECDYTLPFIFPHEPDTLEIRYKDTPKRCQFQKDFPIIEFDNEVSSGNAVFRLQKLKENETILNILNFKPKDRASISIRLSSNLTETINSTIFEIPLIEKYSYSFYPNYSIQIQFQSSDTNTQKVELKYNDKNYTQNIPYKEEIKIDNISLKMPFSLSIPREKSQEQTIKSIKDTQDIIFFIDSRLQINQSISSSIIKFLKNYGSNFRFNIVRIGPNSDVFASTMSENSNDNIDNVEKFLKDPKDTKNVYQLDQAYSNIFRNIEYKAETQKPSEFSQSAEKVEKKTKLIEGVDNLHTTAVFIGSFSDEIIIPRTVNTYLIDLSKKYNSQSFALKNGIINIDTSKGVETSFNNLLQQLRTNTQISTQEDINDEKKYKIMIEKEENDLLNFLSQNPKKITTFLDPLEQYLKSGKKNISLKNFSNNRLNLLNYLFKKSKNEKIDKNHLKIFLSDANLSANPELLKRIFDDDFSKTITNTNEKIQRKIMGLDKKHFTENQLLLLMLISLSVYQNIFDLIQIVMLSKNMKLGEIFLKQLSHNFINSFENTPYITYKDTITNNYNYEYVTSHQLSKPITKILYNPSPSSQSDSRIKSQGNQTSYGIENKINRPKSSGELIKEKSIHNDSHENLEQMDKIIKNMKIAISENKFDTLVDILKKSYSKDFSEEEEINEYFQFESSINLIKEDGTSTEVRTIVQTPRQTFSNGSEPKNTTRIIIPDSEYDSKMKGDLSGVKAIELPRIESPEKLQTVKSKSIKTCKEKAFIEFKTNSSLIDSTISISHLDKGKLFCEGKEKEVDVSVKSEPEEDYEPEIDMSLAESLLITN